MPLVDHARIQSRLECLLIRQVLPLQRDVQAIQFVESTETEVIADLGIDEFGTLVDRRFQCQAKARELGKEAVTLGPRYAGLETAALVVERRLVGFLGKSGNGRPVVELAGVESSRSNQT